MRRLQDVVVEIPNGGAEEQLTWIGKALKEISAAGRFERVLIEVAGTASPAWLAEYFLAGGPLNEWGHLEQIVCVVDALDYFRGARGPERGWREFQDEQIAGATLVVLNKVRFAERRGAGGVLEIVADAACAGADRGDGVRRGADGDLGEGGVARGDGGGDGAAGGVAVGGVAGAFERAVSCASAVSSGAVLGVV